MADCVTDAGLDRTANNTISNKGPIDETLYGSGMGGSHGLIQPIRFCHWAASQVTGSGSYLWAVLFQAAQLAIAALNASIQSQISDMNQELAELYYDMAKDKWERFKAAYMPLEKALIEEVGNVDEPEMDCDNDRERAENAVNGAYDYIDKYISAKATAYRMCLDDTDVAQLNFGRALMLVDTENYNIQDDAWYTDFKSDQRWGRRSNVLNLGRNLSAMALEYGDIARSLLKDVGNLADKAAGQVSYSLGYYGDKFDTFFPTTYLATGGNGNYTSTSTASTMGSRQ